MAVEVAVAVAVVAPNQSAIRRRRFRSRARRCVRPLLIVRVKVFCTGLENLLCLAPYSFHHYRILSTYMCYLGVFYLRGLFLLRFVS